MSRWTPISPWRPIDGSGQSVSYTSGGTGTSTAVSGETYAVQLSCTGDCLVRISAQGTAATATKDALLKATDPAIVLACPPGGKVSAYGLAAGDLYITEMTH